MLTDQLNIIIKFGQCSLDDCILSAILANKLAIHLLNFHLGSCPAC